MKGNVKISNYYNELNVLTFHHSLDANYTVATTVDKTIEQP